MPLSLEPPPKGWVPSAPEGAGGGPPPDGWDGGDDDHGDGDWRDPDPHGGRGWVTLATFWHPAQAHIARLRLEAAGIACVLLDELTAGTHVFAIAVGGVKLQVPRVQAERAGRLLREHRRLTGEDPGVSPTVLLAGFERLIDAKAAACVIEAAGLECEVIEHAPEPHLPAWARWFPSGWRSRLWPVASLAVDRQELRPAVAALRATPFARGLRRAARSGPCGACQADWRWIVWQLDWSGTLPMGSGRRTRRLPRLVRRCGRCGEAWL